MPSPRNSYTFKEGLTMMAAKAIGVDPYLAAEAGENARATLNAIRNAAKTKQPKERAGYIREAQNELRTISAAQHPKLVNALQAKLLALQGRGGDSTVAHVEPGEMVIPRAMLTPEVMRLIASEAQRRGIDPRRLMVGGQASINPATGAEEFGFTDTIRNWFGGKKVELDMTGIDQPLKTERRSSDLSHGSADVLNVTKSLRIPPPRDDMNGPYANQGIYPTRKYSDEDHPVRELIHRVTDKFIDNLEPIDAVTGLLEPVNKMKPILKPVSRLSPLGYVADLVAAATKPSDAPKPNYRFESGDSLPRRIYKGTSLATDVLGPIAGTATLLSPVQPEIFAPIAGAAGLGFGASWLGKKGVSKYCKLTGRTEDCT